MDWRRVGFVIVHGDERVVKDVRNDEQATFPCREAQPQPQQPRSPALHESLTSAPIRRSTDALARPVKSQAR